MGRRYLTLPEAEAALNRGKSIECFIGSCTRNNEIGIRWLTVSISTAGLSVRLFESADIGDQNFTDVYEFGPLDPDLEFEDAKEAVDVPDFPAFVSFIEERFPGASSRLVNQFLVQDEYAEFIARGRK